MKTGERVMLDAGSTARARQFSRSLPRLEARPLFRGSHVAAARGERKDDPRAPPEEPATRRRKSVASSRRELELGTRDYGGCLWNRAAIVDLLFEVRDPRTHATCGVRRDPGFLLDVRGKRGYATNILATFMRGG